MDLITFILRYDFISKKVKLTWNDITYAISQQLISREVVIKYAMDELSKADTYPPQLAELASLTKNDDVHPLIDELGSLEGKEVDKKKWMYLLLAFVFENQDKFEDPFGMVAIIYSNFDYPEEVSNFVHYMPSKGTGSLLDKWEAYLKDREEYYSKD